jgi:PAS domain S-box-containing protein
MVNEPLGFWDKLIQISNRSCSTFAETREILDSVILLNCVRKPDDERGEMTRAQTDVRLANPTGRARPVPADAWPRVVAAIEQLAAARSAETVVDILRRTARQVVDADGIAVVLRDGDFCHYVAEDAIAPLWPNGRFPADNCVSGWAMEHGESAIIADVLDDARVPQALYRKTFVRSMAMVPVGVPASAAIGAYWADAGVPTSELTALLEALARSAATALENVRLLSALEASERRLRGVIDTRAIGIALYDAAAREIPLVNDRMLELAGLTRAELETGARSFVDATAPEYREVDDGARVALLAGQGVPPYEKAFLHPDGTRRFVLIAAEEAGTPGLTVVTVQDLAPIRAAQADLRASEERFRLIAETIREAFYVFEDAPPRITYVSPAYEEIWGRSRSSLYADPRAFLDPVHPEDRPIVEDAMRRQQAGEATHIEYRLVRADGEIRWIWDRAYPLGPDRAGQVVGVAEDITVRREAEDQSRLLAAELDHRTRNVLTMVGSLVQQTLRDPRVPADVRDTVEERLGAFGGAHALLGQTGWTPMALDAIAEAALAPFRSRVTLAGPAIELPPKAAVAMTLALHELATNATKYGALSVPEGRVAIVWQVEERDDARWLTLDWRESDGPPVTPPARRGFGTRMIERSLAADLRGEARIGFAPEGVTAELRARLE